MAALGPDIGFARCGSTKETEKMEDDWSEGRKNLERWQVMIKEKIGTQDVTRNRMVDLTLGFCLFAGCIMGE